MDAVACNDFWTHLSEHIVHSKSHLKSGTATNTGSGTSTNSGAKRVKR